MMKSVRMTLASPRPSLSGSFLCLLFYSRYNCIFFPESINPVDTDKFRAGSSTICLTPTSLCSARQAHNSRQTPYGETGPLAINVEHPHFMWDHQSVINRFVNRCSAFLLHMLLFTTSISFTGVTNEHQAF